MEAMDRLRRYLEQRREMGESELVLDSLSVDAVLRIVGAAGVERTPDAGVARPVAMRTAAEQPFSGPISSAHRKGAAAETGKVSTEVARIALPSWVDELGLPTGVASAGLGFGAAPDVEGVSSVDALSVHIAQCERCSLHKSARNPVPGEGNPRAELLCVGEAPGANEDVEGRPFVGEAGQLLTKILAAISISRDDVFICNVLKHRPPGNRDPQPDEVQACVPYLARQIDLVRPRVILALGRIAAQTLLGTTAPLSSLRSHVHNYRGTPVIVTYHPAALLRNESWKRPAWEDVKLVRRILDAAAAVHGDSSKSTNALPD